MLFQMITSTPQYALTLCGLLFAVQTAIYNARAISGPREANKAFFQIYATGYFTDQNVSKLLSEYLLVIWLRYIGFYSLYIDIVR